MRTQRAHHRPHPAWVAGALIAFAGWTAWAAWARFAAVHNRTFDLALYARQAWGVAHGEIWDPIIGGDFFGGHLAWVLVPLGWIGRVLGTVPVLLCAQSLVVAAAAWPLYRLARERLGGWFGAAAACAWLLYPNLGHVATYEFHPGTLAVWPLMHACCALEREQQGGGRAVVLGSLGALACRASLALQLCALGLLAAYRRPRWRVAALALTAACALYFLLWLTWLQPTHGAPLSAELHFGKWGGSPFGVLRVLLRDPGTVVAHLLAPARISYPLRLLWPLALLPLCAPRWLVPALPPLAINLLSEFPTSTELYSHYLTLALPPLAVGAVAGAAVVRDRLARTELGPRVREALVPAVLLAAAVGGNVVAGGMPWSRGYDAAAFSPDAATAAARAVLARIDPRSSVQAPDALLPHVAERRALFRGPPPDRAADWVVLDVSHRARFAHREDLLRTVEEPVTRVWLARPDHQLVLAAGDLLLLRRGRPARGGLVRRYFIGNAPADTGRPLTACLSVRSAALRADAVELELVARAACPADLAIRVGTTPKPARVDLLFDGLLSPAQLGRGDLLRSRHPLSPAEHAAIIRSGLRVGALRTSGARPEPSDPISVLVALR